VDFIAENIVLIVVAFVSGAMLVWPAVQRRAGGPSLDTLGATRLINDTQAVVLDIREQAEFAAGHLPNARHIPLAQLAERAGELPAGKPVLVCCNTGARSASAAGVLRKAGRDQVFNLSGGLQAWKQAGLPVVRQPA
jgi:rhodanese-related sulfurtransferase